MEIDFGNGNKLNLMPNLGQSTVEVLKEMTQETKDLLSPIADSMKGSMTNIINNVSEMSAGPAINFFFYGVVNRKLGYGHYTKVYVQYAYQVTREKPRTRRGLIKLEIFNLQLT